MSQQKEAVTAEDLAAAWRKLAAAGAEAQAEIEAQAPTALITLRGFTFVGRRLPLERWIQSGRVPQALTAQMIRISRGEQSDVDEDDLSTDDIVAGRAFVSDAITYCVVSPRIVTHTRPPAKGEVRYSEIFDPRPDLIDALMGWIYANCPGVPVRTEGGETSVKALTHFSDDAEGSAGPESGAPVPGGGEAVASAGAA